jgi:hypothetical protein
LKVTKPTRDEFVFIILMSVLGYVLSRNELFETNRCSNRLCITIINRVRFIIGGRSEQGGAANSMRIWDNWGIGWVVVNGGIFFECFDENVGQRAARLRLLGTKHLAGKSSWWETSYGGYGQMVGGQQSWKSKTCLHGGQGLKEQLWRLSYRMLVGRWHFERQVGLEQG